MNNDVPNFTKNLNVLLYDRGLKLKDLAKKIDMPYSTLHYQVNHPSAIQEQTLKKISEVLNFNVTDLYSTILEYENLSDVEIWQNVQGDVTPADKFVITIPFVSQKLSAGKGESYLSDDDIEVKTIDVSEYLARGIDKATLLAAEVRGDSMIDEKIFSGDIVVFSRGLIRQEGIYVINYAGDLMVKKLSFDALNGRIDIISGNRNYPTRTVDAELIEILGKVVGWIHRLDF